MSGLVRWLRGLFATPNPRNISAAPGAPGNEGGSDKRELDVSRPKSLEAPSLSKVQSSAARQSV